MNSRSSQRTGNITGLRPPSLLKQALHRCFYLLGKSLDRYDYLEKSGAPDVLVHAEQVLIRRQLLFLFNLRAELAK